MLRSPRGQGPHEAGWCIRPHGTTRSWHDVVFRPRSKVLVGPGMMAARQQVESDEAAERARLVSLLLPDNRPLQRGHTIHAPTAAAASPRPPACALRSPPVMVTAPL